MALTCGLTSCNTNCTVIVHCNGYICPTFLYCGSRVFGTRQTVTRLYITVRVDHRGVAPWVGLRRFTRTYGGGADGDPCVGCCGVCGYLFRSLVVSFLTGCADFHRVFQRCRGRFGSQTDLRANDPAALGWSPRVPLAGDRPFP